MPGEPEVPVASRGHVGSAESLYIVRSCPPKPSQRVLLRALPMVGGIPHGESSVPGALPVPRGIPFPLLCWQQAVSWPGWPSSGEVTLLAGVREV